jgi:hypothetical protein
MCDKPRLFVPLSSEPFNWFKSEKKRWELRRYGNKYTEKNIIPGRKVELRRGYSDPNQAIWGIIGRVIISNNLDEFFGIVNFSDVIPIVNSRIEAINLSMHILKIPLSESHKVIGFEVLFNSPTEP